MEYLVYAITPLAIGAILPLIYILIGKKNRKKEKKMNSKDFIIQPPSVVVWFAIIGLIVFSLVMVMMNIFDEVEIWINALYIVIILFILFACFAFVREKFIVKDDNIKHIPIIGKSKEISFSDIKYIKCKLQRYYTDYVLIGNDDKRIFTISSQFVGTQLFLQRIEELKIEIRY